MLELNRIEDLHLSKAACLDVWILLQTGGV